MWIAARKLEFQSSDALFFCKSNFDYVYNFSHFFNHVFWNYSSISQNTKGKSGTSLPFCQNSTNHCTQNHVLSSQNCFFSTKTRNTTIIWMSLREHQLSTCVINLKHFHQNTVYLFFGFMRPCYIIKCIQLFRKSFLF